MRIGVKSRKGERREERGEKREEKEKEYGLERVEYRFIKSVREKTKTKQT